MGAGSVALSSALRAKTLSPNSKLQHACIGVGGMGANDLGQFLAHPGLEIVALCDVDSKRLGEAAKRVPGARTYTDWRELLAKEGDRIDSINAAVPDHMHASIATVALRADKHVYCQKPLCHDVAEVRTLVELATKTGKVTQLGTQHASGIGDRMAVEYLRSGVIGKIKQVHLGSNRSNIDRYRKVGPRPKASFPVPAHLDWDLWLGTAPVRDYAPDIYHPMVWRAWQDFGTGWSGDIGCHIFDAVWKGLGFGNIACKTVHAKVNEDWKADPARNTDSWSPSNLITWTFPGNEMTERDEITFQWFDGEFYPPEEVQALYPGKFPEEFALLVGTEGALLLPHSSGPRLLPREKFAEVPRPKPEPRNHYHHFIDAILGKAENESHFAQTGPMTEAILLGTVAIRQQDQLLQWDAASMTFPKTPAANQFVRRTYRKGWEIS